MTPVRSLPVLLALSIALTGTASLPGQETDRREELARELLEVTGSGALGIQVMTQMLESFKAANPAVPEAFWDEFLAEVDATELVELTVPVYVEHLSAEEMGAAIAFYVTPEGQAILTKMPVIVQETMQAGQAWGMEIAQRVTERLQVWRESHPES